MPLPSNPSETGSSTERINKMKAALLAAIGEKMGCNSDRCCCWGAEEVLYCKMGVTVEQLATAAIAALENEERGSS